MATTTQKPRATLFNPQTGDRQAVEIGSAGERELFSKGYRLETQAPGTPATFEAPGRAPVAGTTPPQQQELMAGGYTPRVNLFQGQGQGPGGGGGASGGLSYSSAGSGVPGEDAMRSFRMAQMKLLSQAQQGFRVSDLIEREGKLKRRSLEERKKGMKAEGAAKFATGQQQIGISRGRGAGFEAQLPGTREALQAREAQFGIFKDLFDISTNLINQEQTAQQQKFQNELALRNQAMQQFELISSLPGGYSNLLEVDEATLNSISTLTGISSEGLQALAQAQIDNPDRDLKIIEDKSTRTLRAIDTRTGETVWERKGVVSGFAPSSSSTKSPLTRTVLNKLNAAGLNDDEALSINTLLQVKDKDKAVEELATALAIQAGGNNKSMNPAMFMNEARSKVDLYIQEINKPDSSFGGLDIDTIIDQLNIQQ